MLTFKFSTCFFAFLSSFFINSLILLILVLYFSFMELMAISVLVLNFSFKKNSLSWHLILSCFYSDSYSFSSCTVSNRAFIVFPFSTSEEAKINSSLSFCFIFYSKRSSWFKIISICLFSLVLMRIYLFVKLLVKISHVSLSSESSLLWFRISIFAYS